MKLLGVLYQVHRNCSARSRAHGAPHTKASIAHCRLKLSELLLRVLGRPKLPPSAVHRRQFLWIELSPLAIKFFVCISMCVHVLYDFLYIKNKNSILVFIPKNRVCPHPPREISGFSTVESKRVYMRLHMFWMYLYPKVLLI